MSSCPELIMLKPVLHNNIWGGRRLEEFGYDLPDGPVGECWGIAAHPHGDCMVDGGPYDGMTLSQLWYDPFELIKDKHGFVLGGIDRMKYKEYELHLEPGSKLFVYTDGASEAQNTEKELFGRDRIVQALNTAMDEHPEEILRTVDKAVADFVGEAEQFDDLTMLCIEYRGRAEEAKDL